jgi:hypothetical protein
MESCMRRISARKTEVLGKTLKEYDPNSSWQKAEEQKEETAG